MTIFHYPQRQLLIKIVLLGAIMCTPAMVKAQDRLLELVADELKREMTSLQAEETPYPCSHGGAPVAGTPAPNHEQHAAANLGHKGLAAAGVCGPLAAVGNARCSIARREGFEPNVPLNQIDKQPLRRKVAGDEFHLARVRHLTNRIV